MKTYVIYYKSGNLLRINYPIVAYMEKKDAEKAVKESLFSFAHHVILSTYLCITKLPKDIPFK